MKYWERRIFVLILTCLIFYYPSISAQSHPCFKINIFSQNNGKGLQQSRRILKEALEELGHEVFEIERSDHIHIQEPNVDINIFIESLVPEWFPYAQLNWFIPNPEWYMQSLDLLNKIDLVLCRNRLVENIFKPLVKSTYFMGFSSQDLYEQQIEKNFSSCLHLAGGSPYKGTKTIIQAWSEKQLVPLFLQVSVYKKQYPLEPSINWILNRLPDDQLRTLQNQCGIHLCLSEVEGWGHYLVEGMSTKAVIITTDAPPMNEYITDKRCLVPYEKAIPCYLGTRHFVNPQTFTNVLLDLLSLPEDELQKIGEKNREKYLEMTNEFKENLKVLMESVSISFNE